MYIDGGIRLDLNLTGPIFLNATLIEPSQPLWKALLPVISTLLGALIGGLQTLVIERSRERRQRAQDVLDNFLGPLESIFKETKTIQQDLLNAFEYTGRLEIPPSELEGRAAKIPSGNPLRDAWKNRIERLHEKNSYAIQLIDRFYSRITLKDFKEECLKFKDHAGAWEDVWRAMQGSTVRGNILIAEIFPTGLETALEAEIIEVTNRANPWRLERLKI